MQALATFGDEVAIAWSGAEDVALVEYAHLTGRPFRVFRRGGPCSGCTSHSHAQLHACFVYGPLRVVTVDMASSESF